MSNAHLVASLAARAVLVPMTRPLQTSTGAVTRVPFVLIDLATRGGAVGRSYLFCVTPMALKATVAMLDALAPLIVGQPLAPLDLAQLLERRLTLLGNTGIAAMATAGIDMAAWDAAAIEAGVPLATLLGAAPRPVPAYNSCGLGIMTPDQVSREAAELAAAGFGAVKLRLGYPTLAEDLAAVRAAQAALPAGTLLMTDYNQALLPAEAIRRGLALDACDLCWIEEPVDAHDHAGCARVAAALATPVQIGENFWGPRDMGRAIAAQACDFAMPDAMRIGGVTGWLRAAALAQAAGMPMSTHLFPEVSAHLMCATPTAHWLEYVDWANPVLRAPLAVRDGAVVPAAAPGTGIAWDEAAVARYAFA
ncbi:MAG: mandelate racemase [Burkholderiales bacterium]|nr:mandelate racemase [Burkholderiales bacterium]